MSVYLQKTRGNVIILTILEPTMVAERRRPTIIYGRLDTMSIFNEIEHCYVEGIFIATIILSVCFIEHVIVSSLISNKHVSEDSRIQLGSAINMACMAVCSLPMILSV